LNLFNSISGNWQKRRAGRKGTEKGGAGGLGACLIDPRFSQQGHHPCLHAQELITFPRGGKTDWGKKRVFFEDLFQPQIDAD
jgi:hypothetical protein